MTTYSYRFNLGNFTCIAVTDGLYAREDARFLFKNAPEEAMVQALQAHQARQDHVPASATCLLIETEQHRVLIDTGFGAEVGPGMGSLLRHLAGEGIQPADIDTVILSHGHPDHIGGSTDAAGHPTFPNAQYVMWQAEWAYWTSAENLAQEREVAAKFARENLPPLKSRIKLVDQTGAEIRPGLFAVPAPGHSPGHMAVEIRSGGERLYFLGDTALHPIHFEQPDWFAVVDANPAQVLATRQRLFARIASEQALVLGYHFVFPSLGRVASAGAAWRWQPLPLPTG